MEGLCVSPLGLPLAFPFVIVAVVVFVEVFNSARSSEDPNRWSEFLNWSSAIPNRWNHLSEVEVPDKHTNTRTHAGSQNLFLSHSHNLSFSLSHTHI